MPSTFSDWWEGPGREQAEHSFSGIDLKLVRALCEQAHHAGEITGLSCGQRIFSDAFNALGAGPAASNPAEKVTA